MLIIGLLIGYKIASKFFSIKPFSLEEKVGDPVHIAYGVLTGKLFTVFNEPGAWLAATTMAMLYVVYQLADYIANKDSLAKDIATYAGTIATIVGAHFGIGVPV